MALDLDLCLTKYGFPQKPFRYYVYPTALSPATQAPAVDSFRRFPDLPREIALLIFQFCDAPTLFQLMHTSSAIRAQTSRLFWTHQDDVWYRCSGSWLRTTDKPGYIYDCPHFARQVTQLEIHLGLMGPGFEQLATSHLPLRRETTEEQTRRFWAQVQESYPSLRKVVLASHAPYPPLPPADGEYNETYSIMATVAQLAPPHLTAFIAIEKVRVGIQIRTHSLWRIQPAPGPGPAPSWVVVDDDWTPNRISIPHRQRLPGPLAEYLAMEDGLSFAMLEKGGRKWLAAQTYPLYSPGPQLDCPAPDCAGKFTQRAQWEDHIRNECRYLTRHNWWGAECCQHTPAEVKAVLDAREAGVKALEEKCRALWRKLKGEFGEEGTERRRKFVKCLAELAEREGFVPPGEELEDSAFWVEGFTGWFEEEHVYYTGCP
ncbi:hypothetical protein FQN50_003025 [Emmonsiellopsis sp. PD_5]|nr:hypothetical protein FQN50_003025 [Emmonsiellopsis sp. PD_5]